MTAFRAIAAFALALTGCAHVVWTHGVPDLHQVDPGIYRGGEPTAEGWRYLQSLGVRTDVQLDYDWERTAAPPSGMRVAALSMPPSDVGDVLNGPTESAVLRAVDAMRYERPVFVHCRHGHDRTGLVIATYRHLVDDWTKTRAMAEAKALGFHEALHGLVEAWEKVP